MNSTSAETPRGEASNCRRRVLMRADAGRSIGFGHFVRTLALARYLADDFRVEVASFNPEGEVSPWQMEQVAESGARFLPVEGTDRDAFDRFFLEKVGKEDIVVLDNYYFSTAYQREILARGARLVCIDDMHDRHFVSDVVMTFCPLRREEFSLEDSTLFYGGMEWSFLREPFLRPAVERDAVRPRRVVMAMGGADPQRLTPKILSLLLEADPEIKVEVIAGDTVDAGPSDPKRVTIHRRLSAGEVAALFDRCDLGVFPASTICVEAFARRLPVAAGYFVDNQEEFFKRGVEAGWFAPLGCLLDGSEELLPRMRRILSGEPLKPAPNFRFPEQRRKITEIFHRLADKM